VPQKTKQTEMVSGTAAEAAATLVKKLRDDARAL
jgi:hypothetical protein